jgi:hypothetical protein
MKFIISTILISFLSSILEFFLPWWTLAIVAFIIPLFIKLKPWQAFCSGFTGILIFWLPNILYRDFNNEHILAMRMAKLFQMPNYMIFALVCAVVGSIIGGLAAFSGSLFLKKEAAVN